MLWKFMVTYFCGLIMGVILFCILSGSDADDYTEGYRNGYNDASEKYRNLP